jgi:hypothetical protein
MEFGFGALRHRSGYFARNQQPGASIFRHGLFPFWFDEMSRDYESGGQPVNIDSMNQDQRGVLTLSWFSRARVHLCVARNPFTRLAASIRRIRKTLVRCPVVKASDIDSTNQDCCAPGANGILFPCSMK